MRATPLILASLLALAGCGRAAAPVKPGPSAPPPAATGPVAADPHVTTYACADGRRVTAGYPDRDTAVLTIGDHSYSLKHAMSADGARYTGFGLQWWTRGMSDGRLSTLRPGEDIASDAGTACHAGSPTPPAPGTPGGLPDDPRPVSEAPIRPESAQGAANIAQTYFALLEARDVAAAARLRTDQAREDLSDYAAYHAQVGAPGQVGAAAGSLYVEVPIVIYGRKRSGSEVHRSGRAILRRANDVPGATPEQRRWRIYRLELAP